ncbi:MAG: MotE family protein [Pseudorhodoplanes sp.]
MIGGIPLFLRDVRIIPVVLLATGALFTLKVTGVFTGTGYVLGKSEDEQKLRRAQDRAAIQAASQPGAVAPSQAQAAAQGRRSWAQEVFNFPDVTGSVSGAPKPAPADKDKAEKDKAEAKPEAKPAKPPEAKPINYADQRPLSAAERALLERLSERRLELEQRAREIEMRETLLQAAEQKLQAKTGELKEIESRIVIATQKKEEAEQARMKSLVTMYENMKAKDAARIFDRLDIRLATDVANQINPRRMSDILAQMTPEAAERLTVELAKRETGAAEKAKGPELPKIEGRPGGT